MSIYTLRCEMVTRQTLRETFAVFENPYNLAKITPSWLNFRVVTEDVRMEPGAEIDYVIRWLGFPMRWKTIIRAYEPPYLFIDEQARGPYTLWRHRHTFEETDEGVRVGDQVDYALPFGILGDLAHAVLVKRQLLAIFSYRQRALATMFTGETRQTLAPFVVRQERLKSGVRVAVSR